MVIHLQSDLLMLDSLDSCVVVTAAAAAVTGGGVGYRYWRVAGARTHPQQVHGRLSWAEPGSEANDVTKRPDPLLITKAYCTSLRAVICSVSTAWKDG